MYNQLLENCVGINLHLHYSWNLNQALSRHFKKRHLISQSIPFILIAIYSRNLYIMPQPIVHLGLHRISINIVIFPMDCQDINASNYLDSELMEGITDQCKV